MFKKNIKIILLLILFLLPTYKIFAQSANTGFVSGNIWYSKDPFEEGDKIKIYTLIFNPDNKQLSGTVVFFDKDILLGKKDFVVMGASSKDVSINWTVNAGDHTIYAKIENAKFLLSDGTYKDISLTENKTENSSVTVKKKIIPKTSDNTNPNDGLINTTIQSAQNIVNAAKNDIPASITEPIANTTNTIEAFRVNVSTTLDNKQKETKDAIDKLDSVKASPKTSKKDTSTTNALEKPFEYVKLFFFTLFGIIFKYKILFYGISAAIIFFLLRFIWRLFF